MALQYALNRLFIVTANMGTLFENERVEENWLAEFEKVISQADPDLVALHCQEIGGKDFEIQMPKVTEFVSKLRKLKCFNQFNRIRGWLDTNYQDHDGFTALGNIYIFHERVEPIFLWDFEAKTFIEVTGEVLEFDTLSPGHCHKKTRFPNGFYPDVKWSRKGFLHTRWRLFGSHVISFVNIHMFHDEDNIVALEKSPSVYSSYRRKALEFTFSCLSETLGHREAEDEPLFLYGDFNFRLDFSAVVKHILTANHHTKFVNTENGSINRIEYRAEDSSDDNAVVTVERKRFVPQDRNQFTQHFVEVMYTYIHCRVT
jgi:inositol-1,4,5-trisphosphate 5-phosphatase